MKKKQAVIGTTVEESVGAGDGVKDSEVVMKQKREEHCNRLETKVLEGQV